MLEKYARQIGSWNPKDRGENKKTIETFWNHHLDDILTNIYHKNQPFMDR